MVALALLDFVLSSDPPFERSEQLLAQLVEAAVDDLRRVEQLDDSLSPSDPTHFDRQTAALIRGLYDQWAREAEALLDRIDSFERRSGRATSANTLRDKHGRVRAMLSIPLEHVEEARRQLAAGQAIPLSEVRRELRSGVH